MVVRNQQTLLGSNTLYVDFLDFTCFYHNWLVVVSMWVRSCMHYPFKTVGKNGIAPLHPAGCTWMPPGEVHIMGWWTSQNSTNEDPNYQVIIEEQKTIFMTSLTSDPPKNGIQNHLTIPPSPESARGTCCMAVSTTSWSLRTSRGAFDSKALFRRTKAILRPWHRTKMVRQPWNKWDLTMINGYKWWF